MFPATKTIIRPATPSMVARITALPARCAVTFPDASTVATPSFSLAHVAGRISESRPAVSPTARICAVCPGCMVMPPGKTSTNSMEVRTRTVTRAERPAMVAVITAAPPRPAWTVPFSVTRATSGWLLDHAAAAPKMGAPAAVRATAFSCTLPPGSSATSPAGAISTDATCGAATVMVASPVRPPPVARIAPYLSKRSQPGPVLRSHRNARSFASSRLVPWRG